MGTWLTWCGSDRSGDIHGSVTGVREAEGCCGWLLFAPCLSQLLVQGLTREVCVCVCVVTPISADLSAFPLLLEGDIMFPGGSSGRQ